MGKQWQKKTGRKTSEKRTRRRFVIYFFFIRLFMLLFRIVCFFFSYCCRCNHIGYVIRQFQLWQFWHALSLVRCTNSKTFDPYLTRVRFLFLSCDVLRHMLSPSYILLLSSIILVSLLRPLIEVNERKFLLPPLMCAYTYTHVYIYYRNLPFTDYDTYRLKSEVCFCLLYLISFEHFKTTDSFLLDTIIYVL